MSVRILQFSQALLLPSSAWIFEIADNFFSGRSDGNDVGRVLTGISISDRDQAAPSNADAAFVVGTGTSIGASLAKALCNPAFY